MNSKWFRIGWWTVLVFLFPLWTTAWCTFVGVQVADENLLHSPLNHYGGPALYCCNALSDVMLLALPVGMIKNLRLPLKQRIALLCIFLIGSL